MAQKLSVSERIFKITTFISLIFSNKSNPTKFENVTTGDMLAVMMLLSIRPSGTGPLSTSINAMSVSPVSARYSDAYLHR
jgi:hypothetical protein